MSPITIELVIILLLTIINGWFAMSEVALLSARKVRLQLQHLAERGNSQAAAALLLLKDPNNFLSTVQIGVTLVGVLSGAFGGATIAENIAGYLSRYPSLTQYGGNHRRLNCRAGNYLLVVDSRRIGPQTARLAQS